MDFCEAVLHTTTLMYCKASQGSRDVFSLNQENRSDMTFVASDTKISPKALKPEGINYIMVKDLNL